MRVERVALGLMTFHLLSCGGSGSNPSTKTGGASGGAAASVSGGAGGAGQPNVGAGGMTGTVSSGGAAASIGGAAGPGTGAAGGAAVSSLQPTLTILEPVRPPQAALDSERKLILSVTGGASDDGTVLAGTSYYPYGENPLAMGEEPVVWTRSTGLVRIGLPVGTDATDAFSGRISADGRYVFGLYYQRTATPGLRASAGFFRWSPSAGFITFGRPGMVHGELQAVSRDGKVAEGYVEGKESGQEWFRWTEQDGLQWLASTPGWPSGGVIIHSMSSDGAVLLGLSEVNGRGSVLRWTEAGFQDLGRLPGAVSCQPHEMTPDGSIIRGLCSSRVPRNDELPRYDRTFRWTAADGMVEVPVSANNRMSGDGAVIVATDGRTLSRWTANTLQSISLPTTTQGLPFNWSGISDDGGVGYGYRATQLTGDGWTEPFRFTESGGFERLSSLPSDGASIVRVGSRDGLVLGGSSWATPQSTPTFPTRAVVWDVHGIRDIAEELGTAGLELSDIVLSDVTHVWSGSPLVVVGWGAKGTSMIAWVATLPARR